jgi:hypothetical protein
VRLLTCKTIDTVKYQQQQQLIISSARIGSQLDTTPNYFE